MENIFTNTILPNVKKMVSPSIYWHQLFDAHSVPKKQAWKGEKSIKTKLKIWVQFIIKEFEYKFHSL